MLESKRDLTVQIGMSFFFLLEVVESLVYISFKNHIESDFQENMKGNLVHQKSYISITHFTTNIEIEIKAVAYMYEPQTIHSRK